MTVSREFVIAGNATFTVETPDQGHRTYKVQKVDANDRWPESYFVKLLTGPDNTNDFTYLGKLDKATGEVKTTAKSKSLEGSYAHRLLNRILARVWANDHAAYEAHGYKTHHEGRCGRCGRVLTVPESVESGFGPECIQLIQGA
jgi:hypothetical protein